MGIRLQLIALHNPHWNIVYPKYIGNGSFHLSLTLPFQISIMSNFNQLSKHLITGAASANDNKDIGNDDELH